MQINVIAPLAPVSVQNGATAAGRNAAAPGDASFAEWLNRSLAEVDRLQQEADTAAGKLISGENKDIHGTMIAAQKADIALNLMLEVRNKIIAAYDEIKRMQF